jgi:hypothetical protein
MTNTQAILIGASMIAGAILASNGIHSASAYTGGPYALMHHSNTAANAGVFRIDTSSGEVSYCFITGDQSLACTRGIK